jgi:serine/threonine protein phosphatase 1
MLGRLFDRFARTKPPAPRLPEGVRVYAVGDLHGSDDLLDQALDTIRRHDAGLAPAARRLVVVLGDFVDRGEGVRQVVDRLLSGPLPEFELVVLRGNHEAMLLAFLADPAAGAGWLDYGGAATLASYGVSPPIGWASDARLNEAHRAFSAAFPADHRAFLEGLPVRLDLGDYLFVHAGVRPGVALDAQSTLDLTTIRGEFLGSRRWHGRMVVHGHHPVPLPEILSNRIGIDTGACNSGVLAVLLLEDDRREVLLVESRNRPAA